MHWADVVAKKIFLKNKNAVKVTIASGITPSGKIHVGNLRELLTVDFVRVALQKLGVSSNFVFFWDDFDPLRKIPENLEDRIFLQEYLGKPLSFVKDPCGKHESYARHFEEEVENVLPCLGIHPEYVYQNRRYQDGFYDQEIILSLQKRLEIKKILNRFRQIPLEEDWSPLSIYCFSCGISNSLRVSEKDIFFYFCDRCNFQEEFSTPLGRNVKLTWRVDWPMRWSKENVCFEPGGKDHSSQGGSRETGEIICREIFNKEPPIYLSYDFIGIKGKTGKMSSSSGILVGVDEILKVYEPEIVRYIFSSYKNNVEFTIGLDLDVVRTYEEYDRAERVYFGMEKVSEKREFIIKRSYELAQISNIPKSVPFRVSFRHLCNLVQIFEYSFERVLHFIENKSNNFSINDVNYIKSRYKRVAYWLKEYAPEDFIFSIRKDGIFESEIPSDFLGFFRRFFKKMNLLRKSLNIEKNLELYFYELIEEEKLVALEVYKIFYKLLINKEKGPRLVQFLITIGIDNILNRSRFINFSSEE